MEVAFDGIGSRTCRWTSELGRQLQCMMGRVRSQEWCRAPQTWPTLQKNTTKVWNLYAVDGKCILCMQVDEPNRAPLVLDGGAGEVTGVAWCPTDLGHITTCHDHAAISVWSLDRSRIKEPPVRPPQARHFLPVNLCGCGFSPVLDSTS